MTSSKGPSPDGLVQPELSRIVEIAAIGPRSKPEAQSKSEILTANGKQCQAIAKRFSIPAVEALSAIVLLERDGPIITLTGTVKAHLIRDCVASLEKIDEIIDQPINVRFFNGSRGDLEERGLAGPDDTIDEFECISGETLDIGEILVQQLSLAMEPFPRKPGAKGLIEDYGQESETSPFEILKTIHD